jgi:phage gp46-like protein
MRLDFVEDSTRVSFGKFDLIFDNDQSTVDSLKDAVLISLFTWARATPDETASERFGWWGGNVGSKLWVTQRAKITDDLLPKIKQAIEKSLNWLIEDGVCGSIKVDVFTDVYNREAIKARIAISRLGGETIELKFDDLWQRIA